MRDIIFRHLFVRVRADLRDNGESMSGEGLDHVGSCKDWRRSYSFRRAYLS